VNNGAKLFAVGSRSPSDVWPNHYNSTIANHCGDNRHHAEWWHDILAGGVSWRFHHEGDLELEQHVADR